MGEIVNLWGASRAVFRDIVDYDVKYAMYVFTDRISVGSGVRLAKAIKKHNLGEVVEGPRTLNPNSQSYIRAWVWKCDHKALNKHVNR